MDTIRTPLASIEYSTSQAATNDSSGKPPISGSVERRKETPPSRESSGAKSRTSASIRRLAAENDELRARVLELERLVAAAAAAGGATAAAAAPPSASAAEGHAPPGQPNCSVVRETPDNVTGAAAGTPPTVVPKHAAAAPRPSVSPVAVASAGGLSETDEGTFVGDTASRGVNSADSYAERTAARHVPTLSALAGVRNRLTFDSPSTQAETTRTPAHIGATPPMPPPSRLTTTGALRSAIPPAGDGLRSAVPPTSVLRRQRGGIRRGAAPPASDSKTAAGAAEAESKVVEATPAPLFGTPAVRVPIHRGVRAAHSTPPVTAATAARAAPSPSRIPVLRSGGSGPRRVKRGRESISPVPAGPDASFVTVSIQSGGRRDASMASGTPGSDMVSASPSASPAVGASGSATDDVAERILDAAAEGPDAGDVPREGAEEEEEELDDEELARRVAEEEEQLEMWRRIEEQHAEAAAAYDEEALATLEEEDPDAALAMRMMREEMAELQAEQEAADAAAEEEGGEGEINPDDMSYEALLALGEELGDVKQERWQRHAPDIVGSLPTHTFKKKATDATNGGAGGSTAAGTPAGAHSRSAVAETPGGVSGDAETCMVCHCDFEDGETVKTLPCRHLYHGSCIDTWLADHKTCPLCKAAIAPTPPPSE